MPQDTVDPRIQAAVQGDERAAESLLRELLPRVRNLVRYLVRADADVDDITQEALVALLKGLPTYRGEGRLESWADRIVARRALAHARRWRRLAWRFGRGDLTECVSSEPRPDEYLLRRRTAALLDELPLAQRHAVVLHHVLGMTVGEMAAELKVPAETVRSRLRLGMVRMRELSEVSGSKERTINHAGAE